MQLDTNTSQARLLVLVAAMTESECAATLELLTTRSDSRYQPVSTPSAFNQYRTDSATTSTETAAQASERKRLARAQRIAANSQL